MSTREEIKFIERSKIDDGKWNSIVSASPDYRIYATTAWLDGMHQGWSALVLGDYEAVMPLTARRKCGIKYLAQPGFTQQLGVFANFKVNPGLIDVFLNLARKKFPFAEIRVNAPSLTLGYQTYKNYELSLTPDYQSISGNYSPVLKRNLNLAKKFKLTISESRDCDFALDLYYQQYHSRLPLKKNEIRYLKNLLKNLPGNYLVKQAWSKEKLLATSLFVKDRYRIYNLASVTSQEGRKAQASHFLYDQLILEHAQQNLILDFEGSNVPGIEKFYMRFGASLHPYYFVRWNDLPWPIKLLKR